MKKIKWSWIFKIVAVIILVNNVTWKEGKYSLLMAFVLVVSLIALTVAEQFEKLDQKKEYESNKDQ